MVAVVARNKELQGVETRLASLSVDVSEAYWLNPQYMDATMPLPMESGVVYTLQAHKDKIPNGYKIVLLDAEVSDEQAGQEEEAVQEVKRRGRRASK